MTTPTRKPKPPWGDPNNNQGGISKNPLGFGLLNPITADVDYSDDEREFMLAMQKYMKDFKRRFPTWREVLHVVTHLGYKKVPEAVDFLFDEETQERVPE